MMRAGLACVVCLLAALQAKTPAARDEASIRDVVQRYLDAREHGDPQAVGALFTEDADQLTSSGDWRRGRAAIVRGTLASTQQTGGSRKITIETLRFPAPGVALADGRYELTDAQGATRRMWSAFVLVRHGADWQIASIRNMLPAAAATR